MKNLKRVLVLFVLGVLFVLPSKVNAASLITGINIEGIGDLGLSRRTYDLGYSTSFDYVNITATAVEGVNVEGAGKVSIKEGLNTIVISASDGKTSDSYTINLNVTKISGNANSAVSYDKDGNKLENPNTGAFANVALIGLAILGGALVIIKIQKSKKLYKL